MFAAQGLVLLAFYFTVKQSGFKHHYSFSFRSFIICFCSGLQLLVVQIAEKSPGTEDVASGINIAAFNIGIAIGSYAGGMIVTSSLGLAKYAMDRCFISVSYGIDYSLQYSFKQEKLRFHESFL